MSEEEAQKGSPDTHIYKFKAPTTPQGPLAHLELLDALLYLFPLDHERKPVLKKSDFLVPQERIMLI